MRLCCSFSYHKIYLVICYLVEISLSDMTEVKGCSQMMSLSFNEQANIGILVPDTVVPLLGRDNSSLGVSHSVPALICNNALSECVAARLRSQLHSLFHLGPQLRGGPSLIFFPCLFLGGRAFLIPKVGGPLFWLSPHDSPPQVTTSRRR